MERHDEQQGTQPAGPTSDMAKKIAEYEKTVQAARESLERLQKEAAEAARARQEKKAGGDGEERTQEQPPSDEQAQQTAGDREAGAQAEQQPEAVAEQLAAEQEAEEPQEGGAEEQAQAEPPEGGEQAEPAEEGKAEEPEHAEQPKPAEKGEGEHVVLFDGTKESMGAWKKVGSGEIEHRDDQMHLRAGRDRGLAYPTGRRFDDFRFKAQYKLDKPETPMGVAVRFLDPEKPVPDKEDPEKKYSYDNQAYVAAHTGFEVNLGTGANGKAGTFVGIPVGEAPGNQRQPQPAQLKPGDWNEIEVEVRGNDYTVRLNGTETARFTNPDSWRGKPARAEPDAGYIGFLMGEEPHPGRQAKPRPGALPTQMAGPMLPGGRVAGKVSRGKEAPAAELILRRVEVEKLAGAAMTPEEKKKLGKKKLEALHQEVVGALAKIKAKDQGLEGALQKAYGYAVLPAVGRANLVVGVARGYGEVFEKGKTIGFTKLTQLNLGVQVGGQTFIELLIFGTKESLDAFRASPVVFNANAAVAFVRGAAGTANFRDVTAHSYSQGGMVAELSLGGQKFRFLPEAEAIAALAKSAEPSKAGQKVAKAGKSVLGFGKKLAAKAGGLLKRHKQQ